MYRLKLLLHGNEVRELALESGREYSFGRSITCDVPLEDQAGISRNHFRIIESEDGRWTVQVISKFGDILHNGLPTQSLTLEPGSAFQLGPYDFILLDVEQNRSVSTDRPGNVPALSQNQEPFGTYEYENAPTPNELANVPAIASHSTPMEPRESTFAGNDEATRITNAEGETPYLKIVDRSGEEQLMKLEGRKWEAGRDENSEILLNDKKASRRQFELSSTAQGYFIRDLGSSNGTQVNGVPLAADELKSIRSGDVIQVGGVTLTFEIRDPMFEKKLMVVPPEMKSDIPIVMQSPFELINYPMPPTEGGAVRLDPAPSRGLVQRIWHGSPGEDPKKTKFRRMAIVVAILIPLLVVLLDDGGSTGPKAKPMADDKTAGFRKLSPEKQKMVKETFVLATNLYLQKKFVLASDALTKIHVVLPGGYENSLDMANECREIAELERQREELESEKRKQAELQRAVQIAIQQCQPIAKTTLVMSELDDCLGQALLQDPTNVEMIALKQRVQERIDTRNAELSRQRDYASRVAQGRTYFIKAESLEQKGDYLGAIDAYKRHIASTHPDPENLRSKSTQSVQKIEKEISSKVDESIRTAESSWAQQNFKEALEQIKRAKELDPRSNRVIELSTKFRRDLNVRLKEIYEQSVVDEGFGNIDLAKSHWNKIMQMDTPEGDYYQKARRKLKTYGGG